MNEFERAAALIAGADSVLVTAGAGMGVDCGLPDFRGNEGMWVAYPELRGQSFASVANAHTFATDPTRAWGFYGHRTNLYRWTAPGVHYSQLRQLLNSIPHFVYTTNVDGHFAAAGFEDVVETHGTVEWLQCSVDASHGVWECPSLVLEVDTHSLRLVSDLPLCACGAVARPNILMFSDLNWNTERVERQDDAFDEWLGCAGEVVVIEVGAGTDIPTARIVGERIASSLIRINPREASVDYSEDVSLPMTGLQAITGIASAMVSV